MEFTITFWNSKKEIKIKGKTFKIAFELAVKNKIDFSYAELNDAELNGAELNGAELNGAELNGAKLNGAKLNGAKLNGAELNGAELNDKTDLDYATFPLWCGSFGIKASLRLAAQLIYHFEKIDFAQCPEAQAIQQLPQIKELANKFHRVDECDKIK